MTTLFAFGGMLLDSLLGALLQVRYDDGAGLRDAGVRRALGLLDQRARHEPEWLRIRLDQVKPVRACPIALDVCSL